MKRQEVQLGVSVALLCRARAGLAFGCEGGSCGGHRAGSIAHGYRCEGVRPSSGLVGNRVRKPPEGRALDPIRIRSQVVISCAKLPNPNGRVDLMHEPLRRQLVVRHRVRVHLSREMCWGHTVDELVLGEHHVTWAEAAEEAEAAGSSTGHLAP